MRLISRATACAVLVLAAALQAGGAAAAPPGASAGAGFDLHDVFMEACFDVDDDIEKAAKALEARGARRSEDRDGKSIGLDWSARAPRLTVMYAHGVCAVTSDRAGRERSLRTLEESRPPSGTSPLTKATAGLPDDVEFLSGFRMHAPGPGGRVNVMDVVAYASDGPEPVLGMMVLLETVARDDPRAKPAPAARDARAKAEDPRIRPAARIFLQACFFSEAVTAEQGSAHLEGLGATRMPSASRPAMRQYVLDAGEPLGTVAISLEGTYCLVSISSDDVDADAIARAIHSRFDPDRAVRTDAPGPVGVPPDELVGAWEMRAGSGADAVIIRTFVSVTPDKDAPRLVSFGRFVVPAALMPPPTEPATFDAPPL